MVSFSRARLSLAILWTLAGCFDQPAVATETGDECTPGMAGCSCSDGVCLEGLECREIGCVDPQCVDGTVGCPCLPAGGCDDGLACDAGFCKPPGGGATGPGSATTGGGGVEAEATSDPVDGSVGGGPTSGRGSTGTDGGVTGDDGAGPACDPMTMKLCPNPTDVCVDGHCQPSAPYGPCGEGCDRGCEMSMSGMEDVCTVLCPPACPTIPGLPSTICVENRCYLPCMIGMPGSCPAPMQCTLASDGVTQVCMWPPPT